MVGSSKELWFALCTCILIGFGYGVVLFLTQEVPAAGGLFGHIIGVFGFLLMLMTEVLYSLRKRSHSTRWGRMSIWLQFHIFTGIVGPFMVFLHSSWKFNGLAGITLLLSGVIVISGFIGRYIYTRIPRTSDGIEDTILTGQLPVSTLAKTRRLLSIWHIIHIPIGMALFTAAFAHILGAMYYATLLK